MNTPYDQHLEALAALPELRRRVAHVLDALPENVRVDLLDDPTFHIALEEYIPGVGFRTFMYMPQSSQSASRCVVLRRRLDTASEDFANYVIAHEFAHAFLRNGGWGEIEDREEAADALAASWGFPDSRLKN